MNEVEFWIVILIALVANAAILVTISLYGERHHPGKKWWIGITILSHRFTWHVKYQGVWCPVRFSIPYFVYFYSEWHEPTEHSFEFHDSGKDDDDNEYFE